MTTHKSHWHRSFLLKDLCDKGLATIKGKQRALHPHSAATLSDILPAILAADDLFDNEGVPNFDLHIWLALTTMLVGAGDAIFGGTTAHILGTDDAITGWVLSLDFDATGRLWQDAMDDAAKRLSGEKGVADLTLHAGTFLAITKLTHEEGVALESVIASHKPQQEGFGWKSMGDIHENDLSVKMVSYPASVHPKLKDRTVANVALYVAAKLGDAGLAVREHWWPEDTSKSYTRYILSDGIDHYLMDFHGGNLAVLLSHLDKHIGRDADMGGILLDEIRPSIISLDNLDTLSNQLP